MFSAPFNDFGALGAIVFIALMYFLFDLLYYKKIKYNKSIKKSYIWLLLLGYLYNYVFMTFFKTTTTTWKFQVLVEALIMVFIYKFVTRVKIAKKYGKLAIIIKHKKGFNNKRTKWRK